LYSYYKYVPTALQVMIAHHVRRNFSSRRLIRIGNVEIPMGKGPGPKEQHVGDFATVEQDDWLIPSQYLSNDNEAPVSKLSSSSTDAEALKLSSTSPVILKHLQWMMAKDYLQQDMLLIGPPGSGEVHRRRLALSYAEMMQKPIEILTISGDLTESDLKQRREIVNNDIDGTHIKFIDQAPVRAAKYGRLLLLDGIEKAERNVLPTLNNLLENREMHLEDGTILLPHHRCEELSSSSSSSSPQESHGSDSRSSSFLIPVHPDFRVIALGVPSPPFPGRSLDPPFRSRFQIRRVDNPSSEDLYEQLLIGMGANNNETDISLAKSCAILASAMEDNGKLFPSNRLNFIWKLMRDFPLEDRMSIIHRAYPITGTGNNDDTMNKEDELEQFANIFDANHSDNGNSKSVAQYALKSISHSIDDDSHLKITFEPDLKLSTKESTRDSPSVFAQTGGRPINLNSSPHIVHTLGFRKALSAMIQEHASGNDFLLVSPKGEGKTTYAQEFAAMLGYDTHLFAIYSEMTSQDLLQRRSTDPSTGETRWEDSPLIQAAKKGDICVLDGIEKLRPDVLSSLQSLIVDRDVPLPDGRRAMRHDRSDSTNHSLNSDSVVSVHPCFRVIALASLPSGGDSIRWITPNLMAMFNTIRIPSPTDECLRAILKRYASSEEVSDLALDAILALRGRLTDAVAEECGVAPISTRNMIQVARRMGLHSDLHHVLSSIFLLDLLPPRQRLLLDTLFNEVRIEETKPIFNKDPNKDLMVSIGENDVAIGSLVIPRGHVQRPEMVPSPGAFDISAHLEIIQDLLRDWKGGERSFLLLGNQGVGKNKIIDRLCQISNWEREYIQLHRDSTIGQLTLTPQLEDGKIIWNDSPLIRAVRDGCALLIDEADKVRNDYRSYNVRSYLSPSLLSDILFSPHKKCFLF
jgi:MoxR-like ATPase